MARKTFSSQDWSAIEALAADSAERFGLPERRDGSVVLGTFNIRALGKAEARSDQARALLAAIAGRFDLLAIQEVQDDLGGIRDLKQRVGDDFGLVVSDTTGTFPGDAGSPERLAFLFNWKRIERTELASDITFDRSKVVQTLFEQRAVLRDTWDQHLRDLGAWEEKVEHAKAAGKRKPSGPTVVLPTFVTFIRQPHCASFRVVPRAGAEPIEFLAVNAHLLYGENKLERLWEFNALVEWLSVRAKQSDRMYHRNILMMGDCNLEFEDAGIKREQIDAFLKDLNSTRLKSKKAAKVNFPLLDPHPRDGLLRTSARQKQTYDQIAIFSHDPRLPSHEANDTAGAAPDAYDFGVFRFTDLFAEALEGRPFRDLSAAKRKFIIDRCQWDVSDHMPAWFRLPVPGA